MKYTVHPETFTVEIFVEGNDVPFIRQPFNPTGDAWVSKTEAENWAKDYIANYGKEI